MSLLLMAVVILSLQTLQKRTLPTTTILKDLIGSPDDAIPLLDLPKGTKSVVLNIGSNKDPILPLRRDGPCARTLAFEPIVPHLIPSHPQVLVASAAVSDKNSLSTMYIYNENAVSSSLSEVSRTAWWNQNPGEPRVVPVLTMRQVLRSIPLSVEISMLDTDMQGYDFLAVSSAIDEIRARPIRYLKTETHLSEPNFSYKDVDNDLCRKWLPVMTAAGYKVVGNEIGGQRNIAEGYQTTEEVRESCRTNKPLWKMASEVDIYWALDDGTDMPHDAFDYHKLTSPTQREFTDAEYASCKGVPSNSNAP